MPAVTVICPTYNAAAFIEPTIQSVLHQTYRDFEFIVVDDGSTDHTKQVIEKYANKIRYVYKENGGQSSSRNAGIRIAQGKYIALIDHDDLWLPNKLELQVQEIAKSDSTGLVTCSCTGFRDGKDTGTHTPRINSLNRKQLIKRLLLGNVIGSCSTILVRAECFQKLGFFDESLRMAEDWDLYLRIAQSYDIRCVEQPLVRYRWHNRNYSNASAEINLSNELTVLGKMFKQPRFKHKRLLRARAFGHSYFCAAWMFCEAGQIRPGRECFWRALSEDPTCIRTRRFWSLLITLFYRFRVTSKPVAKDVAPSTIVAENSEGDAGTVEYKSGGEG
jgi:glycosyltransferase involved in cell wall biosynthesis